jgi:hypothetical protein
MDTYKKIVRRRIALLVIPVLIAVSFGIYDVFFAGSEIKNSDIFGFQVGAITAIGILAMINIIRFSRLLKDKKKLQLQYNRENDERYKAIRGKVGMPVLLITSVIMIIVGVVAGYFNITIFYTLIIAALGQMTISVIVKILYMKKM